MAPIITDPKKLSMPQQVQKNKDDIAEIKKVIDGLDSLDNVVIVPDISHIMTAEELKSVKQPVCFIIYNDHLYIKKKEESGNAYFDIVFSIVATTVISFQSSEIEINLSNGAIGITNSTVSTYSNSKIDELLSLKASITYVDVNFASLAGANFTGNITAPSIIENMIGYSFTPNSATDITITINYAGVVKNGNKVTFALAFDITKTGAGAPNSFNFGTFKMPNDVFNKLIPNRLNYLDNQIAAFFSSATATANIPVWISKGGNYISLGGYISTLTVNTTYSARIEATFLLSENLAQ